MIQRKKYKIWITIWSLLIIMASLYWFYAINQNKNNINHGYSIKIKEEKIGNFITKDIVEKVLKPFIDSATKSKKPFNIHNIETAINKIPQVENAKIYVGINGKLNVEIQERRALCRVINKYGVSFYLDEKAVKFPLSNIFTTRVPIIIGNIESNMSESIIDSALLQSVVNVLTITKKMKFWNTCIDQIYVNENKELEIVSNIGQQRIVIGNDKDVESKLNNVFAFYKQGLNNLGWDKYKKIDVRFNKQIICSK